MFEIIVHFSMGGSFPSIVNNPLCDETMNLLQLFMIFYDF